VTFVCHGVVVRIRADRPVLEGVPARLPPGARLVGGARCVDAESAHVRYVWTTHERAGADGPLHVVTVQSVAAPDAEVARTPDRDEALSCLMRDAEFQVALHAPEDVFIHAAAVGWRGRAIVLPGYSYAGKSTVAAELVRLGATYLSDEYTVLGPDGLVHPFARPIGMRARDGRSSAQLPLASLRGAVAATPLRIGHVIVTRYVSGARWRARRLTAGQSALSLLAHAVTARTRPIPTLARIAHALGADVAGWEGDRGEVELFARALLAHGDGAGSATECEGLGPSHPAAPRDDAGVGRPHPRGPAPSRRQLPR
jgi:hypothetical protein